MKAQKPQEPQQNTPQNERAAVVAKTLGYVRIIRRRASTAEAAEAVEIEEFLNGRLKELQAA